MLALADKFRYPPGYFAPDMPNSPRAARAVSSDKFKSTESEAGKYPNPNARAIARTFTFAGCITAEDSNQHDC